MEIVKGGKEKEVKKEGTPVYNPNMRYTWTPGDQFVLTGDQFGKMINAIRAISSIFPINLIQEANISVEEIMKVAVEQGIVKESPVSTENS